MMKNLLTLLIVLSMASGSLVAQNDTLLFENFDVDPTLNWILFPSGNDTIWVNVDEDQLPDGNARPQEWFWQPGTFADVDSADASIWSSSWLAGFLPGNRNWLILPPIQIIDANASLSWNACPRQTPRYADGYTVMVSTTDNYDVSFTDTIFVAAEYDSLVGDPALWSSYYFSPSNGFIHGLDGTYIQFDGDSGAYIGELRPFTASLAQYSGQTIYIAFLHDSDDDNLIALDDILVTGTTVGLAESPAPGQLTVFPNPAKDMIELSYMLPVTSSVTADIYDVKGAKVLSLNRGVQLAGSQKLAIDVRSLSVGSYNIALTIGGSRITSTFVKQ